MSSASRTYHAAISMPMTDSRSNISIEEIAPTWAIKEMLVSAPSKEMLLDLLLKIETQIANSIRDVREMSDENRTA